MPAPKIFISYRRDDCAGHAGRLSDRLETAFGAENVFRDIEDIAAGADFSSTLYEQVDRCGVLLALIGPRWLSVAGIDGHPRLFDPNDWVRAEIARALERRIRVIPVLIGGTQMPAAKDLPADLAALASRNAVEIRDAQFERDVEHLAELLGSGARLRHYRLLVGVLVASLLGVGGYATYLHLRSSDSVAQTVADPRAALRAQLHAEGHAFSTAAFLDAIDASNDGAVALFLRAGMDPNASHDDQGSALSKAVKANRLMMVESLLEHGARDDQALGNAIGHEHDAVAELLLEHPPEQTGLDYALDVAAARGSLEWMERLVALGAKADNGKVLRSVTSNGHVTALDWLIDHGAKWSSATAGDGWTLLHDAASFRAGPEPGETANAMVLRLLEAGIDASVQTTRGMRPNSTPLLAAVRAGNQEAALNLIRAGAQVAARAQDGSARSALHIAAEEDMTEVVLALIEHGATVDERNSRNETALLLAAQAGARATVDVLIGRGADVEARSRAGISPLSAAARQLQTDVVQALLAAQVKVDAVSPVTGETAMHALASRPLLPDSDQARAAAEIIRLLVTAGASVEAKNGKGESVRQLVQSNAAWELVDALDNP